MPLGGGYGGGYCGCHFELSQLVSLFEIFAATGRRRKLTTGHAVAERTSGASGRRAPAPAMVRVEAGESVGEERRSCAM
jgi:hypothetical protein